MESKAVQRLQFPAMVYSDKGGRTVPSGSLNVSCGFMEHKKLRVFVSVPSTKIQQRKLPLKIACSYNKVPASTLKSESFKTPLSEELILKSKSKEVEPYLSGRCIYLVGMMGSGKTTVGKILSQVLCYSFFDRLVLTVIKIRNYFKGTIYVYSSSAGEYAFPLCLERIDVMRHQHGTYLMRKARAL
ncbi:shikimate kinase, chloroplastic-like [Arachis ipaensis]|uniref:shikimate kinase, chloroplastic-like n=1 Tax=Arachis ipaensis TaxID=130454 RepID=UPI000A2B6D03|nr:shikimate kinase, chloroplastic-like [Arachis ipaensis]